MATTTITVVDNLTSAQAQAKFKIQSSSPKRGLNVLSEWVAGMAGGLHRAHVFLSIGSGVTASGVGYQAAGTAALVQASLTAGDIVRVGSVSFVATNGAVTPGAATFDMRTSNNAAGVSLAAQVNAHASLTGLVTAVNASGTVTFTSVVPGPVGNLVGLSKNVTTAAGVILNGLANTVTTSSLTGATGTADATPSVYAASY